MIEHVIIVLRARIAVGVAEFRRQKWASSSLPVIDLGERINRAAL
jgi:hypothetical protein